MHPRVGLGRVLLGCRRRGDEQVVALPLDGRDGCIELDLDAEFPGRLHQLGDQVRIKLLEGTASPVEHLDLCACTRRDVRELQGDVATADEDETTWQLLQLQKLRAGGQVLLARYLQTGVTRAGRNRHVTTNPDLLAHLETRPIPELGTAIPRD